MRKSCFENSTPTDSGKINSLSQKENPAKKIDVLKFVSITNARHLKLNQLMKDALVGKGNNKSPPS